MPPETSLSDFADSIEAELAKRETPRTLAERVLASGANFIFAVAFFSLGLTANVVAAQMSNTAAFIAAAIGLVVLKLWSMVRHYEGARDALKDLARDARLVAMVVERTMEALEKRPHASETTGVR